MQLSRVDYSTQSLSLSMTLYVRVRSITVTSIVVLTQSVKYMKTDLIPYIDVSQRLDTYIAVHSMLINNR
jgi:hypothetical protein